jgi:N-acetylmuramoyl-L-alanine amidase
MTPRSHGPITYRVPAAKKPAVAKHQPAQPVKPVRVATAKPPRYLPPGTGTAPTAPPARPKLQPAQPVILQGEKLMPAQASPKDYRVKVASAEWISLERWGKLYEGWFGRIQQRSGTVHRLVAANMRFDFTPRQRLITCQGMQIWLGFGPRLVKGHLYIHVLDVQKHLAPLISGMPTLGRVAVIDAGHGKDNKGTRSIFNKKYEKEYTLDWAMRLKPLLERKGWRVYLTRATDDSLSLTDRVKFADRVHASVFISLHFNAAAAKVSGLETYCISPTGMPSHFTRGNPDPVATKLPNNPWDASSFQLAARVHNQLLLTCRMPDRGVRRVRFMSVIKGQKRPAILVEGGYLSNPTESRKVDTAAYRQKLAEGVASAL